MIARCNQKASLIRILITTSDEPTIQEAMQTRPPEIKLWNKAIEAEISTLCNKGTWKEVQNGDGNIKELLRHIVIEIKRNKDEQAKKIKARVVAGGNKQLYQRDHESVYDPVVEFTVCLLVLITSFVMRWFTRQVDVKAALLNGDIDRLIYICHPYNLPYFNLRKLHLPHKSLCGLKQAPLLWFKKLKEFFTLGMDARQLKTDCSVFLKTEKRGSICITLVYVDDLIFVSSDSLLLTEEITASLKSVECTEELLE